MVGANFRISVMVSLMDYRDIITIEPGKRSGQPCIRGLRMTVKDVLEYLAGGMSEDEILEDFPDLTREDIHACIAFAADSEREELTQFSLGNLERAYGENEPEYSPDLIKESNPTFTP
jgi:uncharacterized protein (DUF433 family)